METLLEVAIVVAGFLLRFGVPVALTALLAWLLHRLDARWQREAEQVEALSWVSQEANSFEHCWEKRACDPELRPGCLAYQHPDLPCWQVWRDETGHLQEQCLACELFREATLIAATGEVTRRNA